MSLSLRILDQALSRAVDRLKAASGNDHFISQSDLTQVLATYSDNPTLATLLKELYEMAVRTEPKEGGRITHADIDRAAEVIRTQIFPEYRLLPGNLSEDAIVALEQAGPGYVALARALKHQAAEAEDLDITNLALQIQVLSKNLYFNTFHQQDTGIYVSSVPYKGAELVAKSFLVALAESEDQNWETVLERLGGAVEDSDTDAFWAAFPDLQNAGEDRARALELEKLWKTNTLQNRYFRFDNSGNETTHFFVAGTTTNGFVLFMMLRYLWS